jgi:hypothetical protein
LSIALIVAACSVEPVDVTDDDDDGSGATTSASTSSGSGGSGGNATTSSGSGAYGSGCDGLCDKVADAGCANDDKSSCTSECEGLYTQAEQCSEEIDTLIACQIDSGEVMCEGGDAKVTGCDAEQLAFLDCLMGDDPDVGACYAGGGDCNPLSDSCGAGEACDVAAQDNMFHCFPPPNDVPVGGSCDTANGPFCAHGSACVGGTCRAFCCSTEDCATGTCQQFGSGASFALMACM